MEECHVDSHRNTPCHTKGNDFDGKATSPVSTANEEVIQYLGRDQMMLQARQGNAWEFRAHDFGLFPTNLAATISFSGNETDYDTRDGLVPAIRRRWVSFTIGTPFRSSKNSVFWGWGRDQLKQKT